MRITRLSVPRLRNLEEVELAAAPGVNVLCGENGQGKTNLLEAVWLFTGARSFRGAKETELLPFGERQAALSMEFVAQNRTQTAALVLGEQKKCLLNGVTLDSAAQLAGEFCAVVFSPAHLSLIKGGPSERRRGLDLVIGQVKPRYLSVLSEYNRLLLQRNILLRDAAMAPALLDTLEAWDHTLAARGALISKTRKSFVERLRPVAQAFYDGIARGQERLTLSYQAAAGEDDSPEALLKRLQSDREGDLRAGVTSIGPHRDDLLIEIDGMPARAFGSQGQQRSAVLALKLGECALIEQVTGEAPVVLLDDVLSELDENRRGFLLRELGARQIFITCCDPQPKGFAGAEFIVSRGRVTPAAQ